MAVSKNNFFENANECIEIKVFISLSETNIYLHLLTFIKKNKYNILTVQQMP